MDNRLVQKLLFAQTRAGKTIEICVTGTSMNPTLYENDVVSVMKSDTYEIGDILVFVYKNNELLVHRLLDIQKEKYFCKGDNSFRLEDIINDQIIGKIINIPPCPKRLVYLSYLVNRTFVKCRYDIDKTKETSIYKLYRKIILRNEDNIMVYKKNENMDYIQADETSLAVFDPESGDTYFFDETGIDILNVLSEPCDMETLLSKLCKIYEVTPEDVKEDVQEFIDDIISKKVIEVL